MIVVTGAAGFIGSCLVSDLNQAGYNELVIVDDFSIAAKQKNTQRKEFIQKIHRDDFMEWFGKNASQVSYVFHIGARTDTTEFDTAIFDKLNLNYSKDIWNICANNSIPLVYASSAATYGSGEYGYNDSHEVIPSLKPLNPYGESKNDFDKWAIMQNTTPPHWYGLKFFNVYGPNEYHKGRMASVVFHAFNQINESGKVSLFRSHKPEFKDGMQLRDFIYVKDVIRVCQFLMEKKPASGIYNLGSGKARAFLHLAKSVFAALGKEEQIEFIDTPADIRDKYQYFTEANMNKLIAAGYKKEFTGLEEGIGEYVNSYLMSNSYY